MASSSPGGDAVANRAGAGPDPRFQNPKSWGDDIGVMWRIQTPQPSKGRNETSPAEPRQKKSGNPSREKDTLGSSHAHTGNPM
ncbi:unnamed protein product [Diplocarpon coronariae]|nr:hypothetical protein JHW43_001566 [Diplocarpon mali]